MKSRLKNSALNIAFIFLLATSSGGSAQAQSSSSEFQSAWQDAVEEWRTLVTEQGVIGSSLAFSADGQTVGFETFGFADQELDRPVNESTIFHWASITKTLTSIAILQLRDRGLLRLDDPIVDYVPELRDAFNPFGSMEEVTIRHLLSHTAGFRAPTWPWGGDEEWHPFEPTEWNQLVSMMPYTNVAFPPGEKFAYSNPGYIFLGRAIEKLSGDDWEVYVDKNILKPLQMHRSYFDRTPYHLLRHRSNSYSVRDGEVVANGPDFDTGITVSNSGLNAPIPDMMRYLSFLTGSVSGSIENDVLSRESLSEMWEEVVPIEDDVGMGLTFFLLRESGQRFVGHTGGQNSFVSFFYLHPESRTAAIAAFNTLSDDDPPRPDTGEILRQVRKTLFTQVFPVFTAAELPAP